MTRSIRGALAAALLVLLTLATAALFEADAPAWALAANAAAKVLVVGWVFLELDRAWPVWGLLAALVTAATLGGVVLAMGA
jgi:hypothetical protein